MDLQRAIALALCLATSAGLASPTPPDPRSAIRLVYERGEGTAGCPDADGLRGVVGARLGYEPFGDDAPLEARAAVKRVGDRLVASLSISGEGRAASVRRFSARPSDCESLVATLGFVLSVAIDSATPAKPSEAAPSDVLAPMLLSVERRPFSAPALQASVDARAPASLPRGWPGRLELSGGGISGVGDLPGPSVGARLGVATAGRVSLGLEGRYAWTRDVEVMGGHIASSALAGRASACVGGEPVSTCGIFTAGALSASGLGFSNERSATMPYVAAGVLGRVEHTVNGPWSARLELGLDVPFSRAVFLVGDVHAWTASPVFLEAGLSVIRRFE